LLTKVGKIAAEGQHRADKYLRTTCRAIWSLATQAPHSNDLIGAETNRITTSDQ